MIDLSDFLDKKVFAICEDGSSIKGFLEQYDGVKNIYSLLCGGKEIAYTSDGFHLSNKSPHPLNIISIYIANQIPESVQLEQKAKEMQKELEALNAQVEEAKLRERLEERKGNSKLPKFFNREKALRFLENPFPELLLNAFDWESTPQGCRYWDTIANDVWWADQYNKDEFRIPEMARNQILMWAVESYKQDFGY